MADDLSRTPNSSTRPGKSLVIVGGGPSGLSALESLCVACSKGSPADPFTTTIIERTSNLGSGPNFASDQSPVNWLNVAERQVDLAPRPALSLWGVNIDGFPSYQQWAAVDPAPTVDHYPTRPNLGVYLEARFRSIAAPLQAAQLLLVLQGSVTAIRVQANQCELMIDGVTPVRASDVVLTIGHQPTQASKTLVRWRQQTQCKRGLLFYPEPYPTHVLSNNASIAGSTVAVRGLGLAMIDVVKALTEGRGGSFTPMDASRATYNYVSNPKQPTRILPFSLDGLPPAPKPLNKTIDDQFRPTDAARGEFAHFCRNLASGDFGSDAPAALIEAMAGQLHQWSTKSDALAAQKFYADVGALATQWLEDDTTKHPIIVDTDLGTLQMLTVFREMATGRSPASLDYSLGQLWRHFQPTLYEELSYSELDADVVAQLTAIDERMKRYAFGPPVGSVGRLIALAEAKVLSFRVVDDPDIQLDDAGWHLDTQDAEARASVMVNSVLDAPQIKAMSSPLCRSLLESEVCSPVHNDLGVRTTPTGLLIDGAGEVVPRVAALGRLAKGTLIGTDAILECFGKRSDAWATGLVTRWS